MHLILVHTGPDFPTYLNDCISQVRCVSNIPIHVLIDFAHASQVAPAADLTVVPLDSLPDDVYTETYLRTSRLDAQFRDGFWRAASLRFFYIHTYARLHNLKDFFHIEYDNMIYQDFSRYLAAFRTRKMWCAIDSPQRCIPSFLYWQDSDAVFNVVLSLLSAAPFGLNDMEVLAQHAQTYNKDIGVLPTITRDYPNIHPVFSAGSVLFGHLFDAAAVGQYIGGVDPRNIAGDTCGFINETAAIRCDQVTLTWRIVDGLSRPFLNGYPLINLHIHSKDLQRWSSKKVPESGARPDIITGEAIQDICDVYCGLSSDFGASPYFFHKSQRALIIEKPPPSAWNNPPLIFCYGNRLHNFRQWLPALTNKCVLLIHNSDENITNDHKDIFDHHLLIAAYAQNIALNHPKLYPLPIGIANRTWPHGNLELVTQYAREAATAAKSRDIYFYFDVRTNDAALSKCKAILEEKGLVFQNKESFSDYLKTLISYKYAICPDGNGLDSHRIWESLYLGVTPICLRSIFTEKLAAAFPCVLVSDWSEVNVAELVAAWKPHPPSIKEALSMNCLESKIRYCAPSW